MFTVFRVDLYLFHALILEFIQRGLGVRGEKLLYGVILSQRHLVFMGFLTHMAVHAGILCLYAMALH